MCRESKKGVEGMEFLSSLGESLEKEEITQGLLESLVKAKEESSALKDTIKHGDNSIITLKLYSAARTCEETLDASYNELFQAKERGENPTTLQNLSDLLFYTDDLLRKTKDATDNSANGTIHILRKSTFRVQEEAERLEVIDSVDKRAERSSVRGLIISKVEEAMQ